MSDEPSPPELVGPLCVECGHCGWRRLFNADSEVASLPLAVASRRLVCTRCGSRTPVLFRAKDDRAAKNWYGGG